MIALKPISRSHVPAALEKARHFRTLNEPWEAESICSDVLEVDPENVDALHLVILALTDRITARDDELVDRARDLLDRVPGEYDRAYLAGIICERKAKAIFAASSREAGPAIYDWLRDAMDWYEEAAALADPDDDDAILRWNTCARMINQNRHVRPPPGPPSGEW